MSLWWYIFLIFLDWYWLFLFIFWFNDHPRQLWLVILEHRYLGCQECWSMSIDRILIEYSISIVILSLIIIHHHICSELHNLVLFGFHPSVNNTCPNGNHAHNY